MIILMFIAKLLACSGLLYGYYFLFLRNRMFHHYNRFYILFATVLSCIIPFLKIPVSLVRSTGNIPLYPTLNVIAGDYIETENAVASTAHIWDTIFSLPVFTWSLYISVAFFAAFIMLRSLVYIKGLPGKYPAEYCEGIRFYNTGEEGTPFSFFRSIFWNKHIELDSPEGRQIFRHELFHVRQLHTADILFMELICIIGWFNPLFHLARKELKAIHEFLADQYAASENDRYDYAELLLVRTMAVQNLSVTNNFFNNHIKRRITMLTKLSGTHYNYWSRIMALPLMVLLFCFISLHATMIVQEKPKWKATVPLTVVIDVAHGGIDPGAQLPGGVTEKQLCLDISNKIKELSREYNVNVVMTREKDELPGGSVKVSEGMGKRISIMKEANPDLSVSIHINYTKSRGANGIEVYVPSIKRENPFMEKSILAGSSISHSLKTIYNVAPELKRREDAGIIVLDKAPCPAVMVLCGYMSNAKDLAYISNPKNQESIARKILEGIVKYRTASAESPLPLTQLKEAKAQIPANAGKKSILMQGQDVSYILDPLKYSKKEFKKAIEVFLSKGYKLQFEEITTDPNEELLKITLSMGTRLSGATFRMKELREGGYIIMVKADKENDRLIVRSETVPLLKDNPNEP